MSTESDNGQVIKVIVIVVLFMVMGYWCIKYDWGTIKQWLGLAGFVGCSVFVWRL